jgi:hypothetical protein
MNALLRVAALGAALLGDPAAASSAVTPPAMTPTVIPAVTPAAASPSSTARPDYLLVHFTDGRADGEQIYFSTSRDGYRWQDLNGGQPVLISTVGDRGLRDPSIIRTRDGKFYILATDLRIANGKGWEAAQHHASTHIVIFESADLVHWSAPRLVDIAGSIAQAGCAWAPEAIYDDDTGDYLVYWTTISPANGHDKGRIYAARTRDFVTFTAAQPYIDRPGAQGLIDTQIVDAGPDAGGYRYYRASGDGQITIEGSNALAGPWQRLGDLGAIGLTGQEVEGPILFRLAASGEWGLWVDQYRSRAGYLALATADLSRPETWRRVDPARIAYGVTKKRHGSILNISAEEYQRVRARWPVAPAP